VSLTVASADGRIDDKVPISQSEDVVRAADGAGLDVTFDVLTGIDHLYDKDPKYEMDNMYRWIWKLLQRA
jgi:dipeptidyl aminopeptidase/acylaminoacyl peptidase